MWCNNQWIPLRTRRRYKRPKDHLRQSQFQVVPLCCPQNSSLIKSMQFSIFPIIFHRCPIFSLHKRRPFRPNRGAEVPSRSSPPRTGRVLWRWASRAWCCWWRRPWRWRCSSCPMASMQVGSLGGGDGEMGWWWPLSQLFRYIYIYIWWYMMIYDDIWWYMSGSLCMWMCVSWMDGAYEEIPPLGTRTPKFSARCFFGVELACLSQVWHVKSSQHCLELERPGKECWPPHFQSLVT